jgi:non-heme chloroperoxidase
MSRGVIGADAGEATAVATVAEMMRVPVGAVDVIERPDGTRLRAVVAGSGPPVLLVHGFGVAVEWSLVMPALVERGCRVIAYDHRGHGGSTVGAGGWTSDALFTDLVAVVEHFQLADVVLVGHSMGTFTVLGALGDPALRARTRSAVLVSTATGRLFAGAGLPARSQVPLVRSGILQRVAASRRLGPAVVSSALGPDASVEVREAIRLAFAAIPPDTARFLPVLGRETVVPVLPSIDTPLRLVLGECDAVMPLWHSERVVERAQHAQLTLLPRIGHLVNWEAPDAVVAAVGEALTV